ncbi:hypothetical protein GIB67_041702, partial [Kingdonia uniflora]
EKLPLRVHHHPPTWDLTKELQAVQDYVKLKGLDRIGAISYNSYNSALISTFAERWQPETNSFYFKWGEMTPTLDDVEQLVGLCADGDATVIAGSWGFPALVEVFENNLLQGLKAFKALKAGGAGNLLSLKKLRDHYAYKLGKVISDGTATAAKKKKKGLTTKSVARAYMLYICGSFLFPMKKGTDVSARYLGLFAKDKVAKKWLFGTHTEIKGIPHMHDDAGVHQRKEATVNEHGDTPVRYSHDVVDQYDASHHEHSSRSPNINLNDQQITALNDQLQKLKEDKEKESEANINLRETLKEKTSECDLLKETIEQMKAEIELKRVVDEQCALEFADLPRQLDAKCKEIESLKAVNALLMEQLDLQLPPATSLAVLQSHQPVPDTTLAKKYEDLLAAHEVIKKKLIAKEDFEVWRQALKKALASEGMGDTGDPTFEELFEQNERFFTIVQQRPKGDYQEDLVSTAVNLENVVIARREKMAKKKKM